MKKFKPLDSNEVIQLNQKFTKMGICQDFTNAPYHLCKANNPNSLQTVLVCFENGKYYVNYTIPGEFFYFNNYPVIPGKLLNTNSSNSFFDIIAELIYKFFMEV